MNAHDQPDVFANLAVISGELPNDPQLRDLPSGGVVVQFDVTTRLSTGGRAVNATVPVAWNDPTPAQLRALVAGTDVLVVGTVRRRFFRVGGATQSRTEVVADVVIPTRRRTQVARALRTAADRLLAGVT